MPHSPTGPNTRKRVRPVTLHDTARVRASAVAHCAVKELARAVRRLDEGVQEVEVLEGRRAAAVREEERLQVKRRGGGRTERIEKPACANMRTGKHAPLPPHLPRVERNEGVAGLRAGKLGVSEENAPHRQRMRLEELQRGEG